MLKMKKIIAILLAVCFLVSITAAAASANDRDGGHRDGGHRDGGHWKGGHGDKHFNNGYWDNGYWGHHRVGHREFFEDCGCWKTVYVVEKQWILY
jgi:hypothetical protein